MKKQTIIYRGLMLTLAIMASNLLMAQVEVGLRAGLNLSNIHWKDDNGQTVTGVRTLPGFHAGVTFDIPVAPDFYIQPGALFTTKGGELRETASEFYWDEPYYSGDYTRLNAYYLEVPFNFIFKPQVGMGRLMVGAGPYVAYGIGGKYKDYYDGTTTIDKLEFLKDWDDQSSNVDIQPYGKPLDFGLNVLGGYEFNNRFSVQLNGGIGLANIEPNDSGSKPNGSMRNSTVGISVGYKF